LPVEAGKGLQSQSDVLLSPIIILVVVEELSFSSGSFLSQLLIRKKANDRKKNKTMIITVESSKKTENKNALIEGVQMILKKMYKTFTYYYHLKTFTFNI